MSGLSSGDEYTEEELLEVCEELGLPFDEENINILKEAIDELIAESDLESADGSLNSSLFGSLSVTTASQSSPPTSASPQETVSSPIRRQERTGYHDTRQSREVPLDVPSSRENEEMQTLISSGRSPPRRAAGSTSDSFSRRFRRSFDNGKENRNSGSRHASGPTRCMKHPSSSKRGNAAGSVDEKKEQDEVILPDPSLRRTEKYAPGQLVYRHDPVKKFELYREEWARKPPPGEQKRLALRWKVREYMLRQDLPSFDPRRPLRPRAAHDKDWSPRPYLD